MNTDNIKEISFAEIDPGNSELPETLKLAADLNCEASRLMQCITETILGIERIDSYELVRLAKQVSSIANELTTSAETAAAEACNCPRE